jgi:glycosyltransferase involved in cell wall biosynthesis
VKPRTFLAAVGDVNDPVTWSGIPYHFMQSARGAGLVDEGLPLSADGRDWRARRAAWNLARVAGGDRRGGYQYSRSFLEKLWAPFAPRVRGGAVINCFQLFPTSMVRDSTVSKWFFIDQTLLQLFDYYGQRPLIGRRIARDALEREREGYHAAAGVIAHSRWAARSVVGDYGVPASRVHVVLPGANLDEGEYPRWEAEENERRALSPVGRRLGPLRLVFVGKYWKRKGLDRLLGAMRIARPSGLKATLRVIGCRRAELPEPLRTVEGVEWLDFIDKRRDAGRLFRTLADCDVGCLLSRVEAGGIALREYHALGLVALGPDTGGAPEHMVEGASIAVSPSATDEEIAGVLLNLERDSSLFDQLRLAAWNARRSALWDETVRRILAFWPGAARPLGDARINPSEEATPALASVGQDVHA